jgi:hypothetical protein
LVEAVEVPTTGLGGTRETTNFRLGRSFGVASLSPTGTHFSSNPHNGQCCSTSESLKPPAQAPHSRDASFAIMMLEWFRPGMEEWSRGQSSAELRSPNGAARTWFSGLPGPPLRLRGAPSRPVAPGAVAHQGDIQLQISVPGRSIQSQVRQVIARARDGGECLGAPG